MVFTVLAFVELVNDKLPTALPRTMQPAFIVRIVLDAFAVSVIDTAWGYLWTAPGVDFVGVVLGTLGGYQTPSWLVAVHSGQDLSIALLAAAVAVLGGFAIVTLMGSL
ncbi:hypothetical protein [Mycobacterium uberis]|uniref:hypothetical protein n=1 Tax=Mycobacterium uberis TaxID=2162698 RepID=UPI001FB37754|nr:hypothetical protein [Mycobacterium uberis]